MSQSATNKVEFYDNKPDEDTFLQDIINGLSRPQRTLPAKYFYDEAGSRLFDEICHLPEYYPTRTEIEILRKHRREIAEIVGKGILLIEPGSGSSQKVRLLLDALKPDKYVPIDISGDYLIDVASELAHEFPWLDVHAACIDFTRPLDLSFCDSDARKVAFFPGSSIGNFEPDQALQFLTHIAQAVGEGGGLLIGVDLKKNHDLLKAAYNDTKGVTGKFNLNVLEHINKIFDADFKVDNFAHDAFYNEHVGRIEMHLQSVKDHTVTIEDKTFDFSKGETIHTESSYKYTVPEFQAMADKAGLTPIYVWTDEDELFSVHYFEVLMR